MKPGTVVAVFREGEDLRVPLEAIAAVGTEDGTPLVFEPHGTELRVRPMTTQEEIDWERASGAPRQVFHSGEEFEAYLDSLRAADDPA